MPQSKPGESQPDSSDKLLAIRQHILNAQNDELLRFITDILESAGLSLEYDSVTTDVEVNILHGL